MNRIHWQAVAGMVAIVLCLASTSAAQVQEPPPTAGTPQARLTEPSFVTFLQGKEVSVTLSDGFVREGRVSSVNDRQLVLGRGEGVAVPLARIVKIERVTRRIRWGTLIGLAAGAGISLPYLFTRCSDLECDESFAKTFFAGFGAGVGAGAGAIAGAIANRARRDQDVFFTAAPGTFSAAVAPILTADRKGVAVSLSWR